MIAMTKLRQAWFRLRYRQVLRRHGLVAIPTERFERLCAASAATLVAEVEHALIRASGGDS